MSGAAVKLFVLLFAVRSLLGGYPPRGDGSPEDKAQQLDALAGAIVGACHGDAACAALVAATGFAETGYDLRVHRGDCRAWECDQGRARGPWQAWQNGMPEDQWARMTGVESSALQANVARDRLALGLVQCRTVRGAMARYLGLPCHAKSGILENRYRLYLSARATIRRSMQP